MEWSNPEVLKIIALYRQYPCLWEFQNPEYKRVVLKKQAWREIAKEMGKSLEEVKKKIKYLRNTYVREKRKTAKLKASGSASDDVRKPHLFYYNEFNFLDSIVVLRNSSNNLPKESFETYEFSPEVLIDYSPESSTEDSGLSRMPISTPEGDKCRSGIKRSKIESNEKFNETHVASITKEQKSSAEETMFTAFGKSISKQLAQLPLAVSADKMVDIQKILADAINEGNKKKKCFRRSYV